MTDYFTMMKDVAGSYGKGLGQYRAQQYEDEKRAREKVIQGREDDAYTRAQTQIKDEDAAVQQYGLLTTKGKADEVAMAANRTANQAGLDGAFEQIGRGQPVVPPTYAPMQAEYAPATDLDKNRGLQAISRARRDWNGVASLQKEEKTLAWGEGFGAKLKEYTGSEEQIGASALHLNGNSKRVSMGDPEKSGAVRLSVVKPNGRAEFMKLTRQDQAKLYAAASMMGSDPTKALGVMAEVNKSLAEAIAADNGIEFKLAEAGDRVAGRIETNRHNRVTEGNDSARVAIARGAAGRTSAQNLREYIDPKGNTVLLDVTDLPKDREGRLAIPAGLRPKTSRPEFTMKDVTDLATMYTGQPDPDAPKTAMSATRAMQVARQELGAGGNTNSVSDTLLAGLPMEDPRKPAPVPAPAPKGGMTPPRQVTTIVPPRSGADMRPRPVESDQEMFIRSMGY